MQSLRASPRRGLVRALAAIGPTRRSAFGRRFDSRRLQIVYCNVGTLASGTACVATVLPMPVEHLHRAPPYVRRQVRITQGAVVMSERLYSRSSRCCTISMCKGRDIRSGTEAERLRGFPLVGEGAVV